MYKGSIILALNKCLYKLSASKKSTYNFYNCDWDVIIPTFQKFTRCSEEQCIANLSNSDNARNGIGFCEATKNCNHVTEMD